MPEAFEAANGLPSIREDQQPLGIVVGIATAGRREQVLRTLEQLCLQERLPDRIVVCPASDDDFDAEGASGIGMPLEVVRSARGLCVQRNAILRASRSADLIVFFDDDYYPAPDYLAKAVEIFQQHPEVMVATSWPKHDGAIGPGISHEEAVGLVEAYGRAKAETCMQRAYGGYGCNMVIRLAPVFAHTLEFDERLPLYGWLEDVDFTRRLAPFGRIVSCSALRGVHLGTKAGRGPGLRFGYSQIANPLYMLRKGSVSPRFAARQILRNVAKNVTRSLKPEPWIDRRGRLLGNVIAVKDLLRGELAPENILNL